MAYRVVAAPSAENDINATVDYIVERRSIAAALHWRDDLVEKMQTLRQFPTRCPIAEEESAVLGETIRLLIVEPYLVFFRVVVDVVEIVHVRHGARQREA